MSAHDTFLLNPCVAVNEILAWSGDATFRYWTMLFGLGGWVPTGRGWIENGIQILNGIELVTFLEISDRWRKIGKSTCNQG